MEHTTTDIVLAAYLAATGHQLQSITCDTGSKGTFTFEDVEQKTLTSYHLGQARIEPQKFNDELRRLVTTTKAIAYGKR